MNNLSIVKNESALYLVSPLLEKSGMVKHFFSTRIGGISSGIYEGLNLGVYTDDKKENISSNLEQIFNAAGMSFAKSIYLKQMHSSDFFIVDSINASSIKNSQADAIITKEKNIPIGIFTADCVPILLLDKEQGIVASIHAGWKGTNKKIAFKVIKFMINNLGTNPTNLIAAIGPSIGPCCFEVAENVAKHFDSKEIKNGAFYVDLWDENLNQIKKCDVSDLNIDVFRLCSKCNSELFYSYRRDNGNTGRMGSFIELI